MTAKEHRERAKVMREVADALRRSITEIVGDNCFWSQGEIVDINPGGIQTGVIDCINDFADREEHLARELERQEASRA